MQLDYHQKRAQMPSAKRELWSRQQAFIRAKISMADGFQWKPQELEHVAGVDVSFSSKFQNAACVGLVVYSIKARKIIYEQFMYVVLKEEYIPGFLAFRELPPTLHLFQKLKKNKPHLWPQLVLVDGNGILHKYQCGYASHLGVLLDLPTIGCAKSFFDIDGLHQQQVEAWLKDQLRVEGESLTIKGKSGKEWCKAILADQDQDKHLFVSVGHRISLQTAGQIVRRLTWRGSPEPIRLADLISRKMIRKMQEEDYVGAPSFDMIYLSK